MNQVIREIKIGIIEAKRDAAGMSVGRSQSVNPAAKLRKRAAAPKQLKSAAPSSRDDKAAQLSNRAPPLPPITRKPRPASACCSSPSSSPCKAALRTLEGQHATHGSPGAGSDREGDTDTGGDSADELDDDCTGAADEDHDPSAAAPGSDTSAPPSRAKPTMPRADLRKLFIDQAMSYLGVPYARRYFKRGSKELDSPIFLDCCGLVRRSVRDLKDLFGFKLKNFNQNYMFDTLPDKRTRETAEPGDLVFYEAKFYEWEHDRICSTHSITHVEIFLGAPALAAARPLLLLFLDLDLSSSSLFALFALLHRLPSTDTQRYSSSSRGRHRNNEPREPQG
jgi:cell wall-associated NlpC family hydrolase